MSLLRRALPFLVVALPAVGQSQTFEAVSISPARASGPDTTRLRVERNGDLSASGVSPLLLIGYAYDVPVNPSPRLSGLPVWRETYDIQARAPVNTVPASLSERDRQRRVQGLVRGLLADRFKLVMRVEQKTTPVYALTVARGGPQLRRPSIAENDCVVDTAAANSCHHFVAGRGHPLNGAAVTMDDLALYIENWTDLPVVNRTALDGLYVVDSEGWRPMQLPPPPPSGNPAGAGFDDLPTIVTVLRRLGLELNKQDASVLMYTVERIARPVVASR